MKDYSKLPYRPCAGIMLANREGQVFVGQRLDAADSLYPDAWQMPQGGIDKGEEAEAAALRELREETGVVEDHVQVIGRTREEYLYDLPDELLGKVWKGKYRGQKQLWFVLRFKGPESAINIDTDHPEFAQWKWTDSAGLVSDIVSFKRDIYQALVTEFSGHLA